MICRNCGFQNAPGDTFCGSCGTFLEWTGEAAGTGATGEGDETSLSPPATEQPGPPAPPPPAPREPAGPPQMARPAGQPGGPPQAGPPQGPPQAYGAVVCWNCGRSNPPSRSFCMTCGERLSVESLGGPAAAGTVTGMSRRTMAQSDSGGRGRMLGIAIGLIAVLLLAGGAMAILLSGGDNPASPGAITSPSPEISPEISPEPTLEPTTEPTLEPTLEPTAEPPPTVAPVTPPPVAVDCSRSSVPTSWINLDGANTSVRVRRTEYWCIHQVVVVPDPNFGEGRIRLRVDGQPILEVNHAAGGSSEYPFNFVPARLAPSRTDVEYRMTCAPGSGLCNAIIQVGYEPYPAP